MLSKCFSRYKKKSLLLILIIIPKQFVDELVDIKNKKLFQCHLSERVKNTFEERTINYEDLNNSTLLRLNQTQIASDKLGGKIIIFDMRTGSYLKKLVGHTSGVRSIIKVSKNLIASGSLDQLIKIWDLTTGKCINTLREHTQSVTCLIRISDNQIISGGGDYRIIIWNISRGKYLDTLMGHTDEIVCLVKLRLYDDNNNIDIISNDNIG